MRQGTDPYSYKVIAESTTSSGITEVLYLQGPSFEEAAKRRSVLGLRETHIKHANIYRTPVGNSKDTILIGTVKNERLVYESLVDRVKKGLDYLMWNYPELPAVKAHSTKVEVLTATIIDDTSGNYVAESYTIKMKIDE